MILIMQHFGGMRLPSVAEEIYQVPSEQIMRNTNLIRIQCTNSSQIYLCLRKDSFSERAFPNIMLTY